MHGKDEIDEVDEEEEDELNENRGQSRPASCHPSLAVESLEDRTVPSTVPVLGNLPTAPVLGNLPTLTSKSHVRSSGLGSPCKVRG